MESPGLDTIARLTIPADAEYLGICRLAAAALGGDVGLSDVELADLRLLVSEVCAYAIGHAPGGDGSAIGIELRLPPGELEVSVQGRGLAFTSDGERALGERAAAAVIERLSTRSNFSTAPGGDRLTFAVSRPAG